MEPIKKRLLRARSALMLSRTLPKAGLEKFRLELLAESCARTRAVLVFLFLLQLGNLLLGSILGGVSGAHSYYQAGFVVSLVVYVAYYLALYFWNKAQYSYNTRHNLLLSVWVVCLAICTYFTYLDFSYGPSMLNFLIYAMALAAVPCFTPAVIITLHAVFLAVTLSLAVYFRLPWSMLLQISIVWLMTIYAAWLRFTTSLNTFTDKEKLKRANSRLTLQAETDQLTGLANRRGLERQMQLIINLHKRNGTNICIFMMDVDYFKQYNDKFLHIAGDECLQRVADCLQGCGRRSSDVVARFGGEEFVLVGQDMKLEDVRDFALHLKNSVAELGIFFGYGADFPVVTISVGAVIGDIRDLGTDNQLFFKELLETADRELYNAKACGRNCVSLLGEIYR